ncbi:MAG: hypothetical protein M0P91_07205 [Sulfuricurvum sp.]|jgi:hypothetical protein|uniref:hypothetical protein n=1 Tax=Sulfuricurvum sp. TaxID=2025608 RepID=UPI0025F7F5CE|nr:hypothetical protein [Sulfuricurvum sp.]MCK9372968.1 hypothetical protein [Sulfuricurvum sp.]
MGEKRQKSQLLGFFSFGTQADARSAGWAVPATLRALPGKCVISDIKMEQSLLYSSNIAEG